MFLYSIHYHRTWICFKF